MHRTSKTTNAIHHAGPKPRGASSSFSWLGRYAAMMAVVATSAITAQAQPSRVLHADYDYGSSGFVAPAGMVPPEMYPGSPVMAGFPSGNPYSAIAQVGLSQRVHECGNPSCDGSCDGVPMGGQGCDGFAYYEGTPYAGGCDSGFGGCQSSCGGCGLGHSLCAGGNCGLFGKLRSGHWDASRFCLFCRGDGCGVCQSRFSPTAALGALAALAPYQDAGLCAQRWYDVSAEALFLGHGQGISGGTVVTRSGTGFGAPAALSLGDIGSTDLEAGIRLSAAIIMGPGGNLEVTYMGGHEWSNSASVADTGAGLFSFISDFGTNPVNGFDDTDRSLSQSIAASSEFHSGELNYRRRTMGPYCRFQGSWLVGLRYLRYDNNFGYSTLGENNNTVNASLPRFFSSNDRVKNSMFGAQVGFDFWWNIMAGVNLGIEAKGAWMQNDIDRNLTLTANSLNFLATPGTQTLGTGDQDSTLMGEFQTRLVYRLSHSWSLTSAYYVMAVEDVAFGGVDENVIRTLVDGNPATDPNATFQASGFGLSDLVLQGVSVGAEYIW